MIQHMDAVELALEYLGIHEFPGSKHNQEIIQFFEDVGHGWVNNDEMAWCAAFIGAVLKRTGYEHTGKLNARSYLDIGKSVIVPQAGDIVVFWRISKDGPYGHVGFYLGEGENTIFCLGGNQSDRVKVSEYPKSQVLGYRRIYKLRNDG